MTGVQNAPFIPVQLHAAMELVIDLPRQLGTTREVYFLSWSIRTIGKNIGMTVHKYYE